MDTAHDATCTDGFSLSVEPTCPGCKERFLKWHREVARYDELDRLPVIGHIRRFTRAIGDWWRNHTRDWFRGLKWRITKLLNKRPGSRFFYPLFQVITLQRVWIVEGWWVVARTNEKAVCYWGDAHFGAATPLPVAVRRVLSRKIVRFTVDYAGHGTHSATPL